MGFFKSIFSSKNTTPEDEQQKLKQKEFEVFKFDGLRAQRMGNHDYAIKCFNEALKLDEDFETMGYLSQTYAATNQLQEARDLLLRMTELEPTHTDSYLSLANICYLLEDYDGMNEAAQLAVETDEDNAVAHFLLGQSVCKNGKFEKAIDEFSKAIALKSDYTQAILRRAEVLIEQKRYEEAGKDVDRLLRMNADDESALLLSGQLRETAGDLKQAVATYRHIVELDPFNEQAYLNLSGVLMSQTHYAEAADVLSDALEIKPDFAQALMGRAEARKRLGDAKGAEEDLQAAHALNEQGSEGNTPQPRQVKFETPPNVLGL